MDTCDIVCFLDNNLDKWGQRFYESLIENPENILHYEFDYVVIMCQSKDEVHNQLISLGVSEQK